jgi:putative ABC transport system substrate-binding protein
MLNVKLLVRSAAVTAFCVGMLSACDKPSRPDTVTIGIIEPLEHKAMNEIVAGFEDTLKKEYHKPFVIKIENAQNDPNLARAIIQKMRDENYTFIAPIGVSMTQMTLSMTDRQPVVSLASDLMEKDRQGKNSCHVAIVHDEISPTQLVAFIHKTYPRMTQLTLIHSAADNIFPEVNETIAAGKAVGIKIEHKMVSSLPELTSIAESLPSQTQAIFVLKDNLIVSGIATLSNIAAEKHIPLITSDQGSVQTGAGFALGVHEREIGVQGAKLTAQVLQGKPICDLPIAEMKNLTVFINQKVLQTENQTIAPIIDAAKTLNYQIEYVD